MKLQIVSAIVSLIHVQHEYEAMRTAYNATKWREGFTPQPFEPTKAQVDTFTSNLKVVNDHKATLPQPSPETLEDKAQLQLWGMPRMDSAPQAEWFLCHNVSRTADNSVLGQDIMFSQLAKLDWPEPSQV